jgi:hypothetical protein
MECAKIVSTKHPEIEGIAERLCLQKINKALGKTLQNALYLNESVNRFPPKL